MLPRPCRSSLAPPSSIWTPVDNRRRHRPPCCRSPRTCDANRPARSGRTRQWRRLRQLAQLDARRGRREASAKKGRGADRGSETPARRGLPDRGAGLRLDAEYSEGGNGATPGAWGPRPTARSSGYLETGPEATPSRSMTGCTGVARVRGQVRHLEPPALLGEASAELGSRFRPLQLPHRPDDAWLGLRIPGDAARTASRSVDEDKLLYTAYLPGRDDRPDQPARRAAAARRVDRGDPRRARNAGLAFHYDRPNSEPPQTLLLAPPDITGGWRWADLVDTVRETMDAGQEAGDRARPYRRHDGYARFLPACCPR